MEIIAITQARTGSTRLPAKIFREIQGESLLRIHLRRLQRSKILRTIVVATTNQPEDIKVCDAASELQLPFYRGSTEDVLDRFYQAAKPYSPDYVVRVTSDCPLIDAELVDAVIKHTLTNQADYGSNVLKETFPDGQDVEVCSFSTLRAAWEQATLPSDREHVTPFIRNNSDFNGGKLFKAVNYAAEQNYGGVRMTVDELADFEVINALVRSLGTDRTWKEYADYLISQPDIAGNNSHIVRNEGYQKSINKDQLK